MKNENTMISAYRSKYLNYADWDSIRPNKILWTTFDELNDLWRYEAVNENKWIKKNNVIQYLTNSGTVISIKLNNELRLAVSWRRYCKIKSIN